MKTSLTLSSLVAVTACLLTVRSASAANDTWTGGGSPDGSWLNAANWGGTAPAGGDYLNFAGSAQTAATNNFTAGTAFGNLSFSSGAASFTLNGNGVLLGGVQETTAGAIYGGSISNLSANNQIISLPLTNAPGNHTVITASGAGQLTLPGTFLCSTGALVQFYQNGGAISSTLPIANGILGGWALYTAGSKSLSQPGISEYLGNATVDWAVTNASGQLAAYSSYTTVTGSGGKISNSAGSNVKVTSNGSSDDTMNSSGTTTINTLNWTATSHYGYLDIPSGDTLRFGAAGGVIANCNQYFRLGNGNGGITAGGAASTPGTIYLYNLSTNYYWGLELYCAVADNGTGYPVTLSVYGSVALDKPSTYSGGTYVNAGDLYINTGSASPFGFGPVYVYPGARVDLGNENGENFTNSFFIAGNGFAANGWPGAIKGTYNGTLSGPITLLGNAWIDPNAGTWPNTCTFTNIGGTGNLTFGGPNNVTAGTATLAGVQSYSGDLVLDASANANSGSGVFFASGKNNLMNIGGNLNLLGGSSKPATFDLNGTAQTINGLTNTSGTAANSWVTNSSSSSATLTVGNNGASATFSGLIVNGSGSLTLVKTGAGTQTLSGVDTYTGNTVIEGGTLALAGAGAIAQSPSITVSNATFDVSAVSSYTGTGNIRMTNGTLNLGLVVAGAVGNLAVTNSALDFPMNASSPNITVTGALVTGGSTNVINITVVPGQSSYPVQTTLIKYGSFANVDGNNDLTNLGVNLPALGSPAGYLTNNVGNSSIDLVLTSGPIPVVPITWNGKAGGTVNGNWDILNTADWVTTSGGTPYEYQDTSAVTFDDTLQGTTNVVLTTTVLPGGITINNTHSNYVFSGTGKISGTAALTLQGTGSLLLTETGGDNFSGGVTVNSGTLVIDNNSSGISGGTTINGGVVQVGNNDANGALPAGGLTNNSSLVFSRTDSAYNLSAVITGTGAVVNNGAGTVTLGAANSFTGGAIVNNGALAVSSTGGGSSPLGGGNPVINTGGTLVGRGSDCFGYAPNTAPTTLYLNGGTVTDVGSSSYRITLPNLNFTGGTLASAAGNNGDAYGNYSLFGAGGSCTVTTVATNVTAVISAAKISLQSPTSINAGAGTATNGVDLLVSAAIVPYGVESLTINESGAGVVALDNNNTYGGTTSINGGVLQLGMPGDTAALTEPLGTNVVYDYATLTLAGGKGVTISNAISGTGALIVSSGTNVLLGADSASGATVVTAGKLSLVGAGAINGSASISLAGATLDVSASGSAFAGTGPLTLTNSTLNLGTNLATGLGSLALTNSTLTIAANLNNANITVSGTLTTGGGTNVISLTALPGMPVYPTNIALITYASADPNLADGNNNLTSLGVRLPAYGHPTGYLTNNTTYPYSIQLVLLSGPSPITPISWSGETNGVSDANWDILGTSNWVTTADGVTPYFYQDGSVLTFPDTAPGATTVNLTTTLSPASITVSNAVKTYTFGGSGSLAGSAGLTKEGTGTLILDNSAPYSYTGGNLISGGTVQVGNNDANGSLSGNVTNNGSLVFNQNTAGTFANVISGTGTVVQNGTNNLALAGANTYTGQTVISSNGTVNISAENNLGGNPATFAANQLDLAGGTLELTAGATLGNANRGITVDNTLGGVIAVDAGLSAQVGNVITGGTLTKSGTGALVLTNAANAFTNAEVAAGTLRINTVTAAAGTGPVTVQSGAELYLNAAGAYANAAYSITGYGVAESDGLTHLGAIRFASSGIIPTNIVLQGDAGISPRSANPATVSGVISGAHNISFGRTSTTASASTGTLVLANPGNSWTGNTTNLDGMLKMGAVNVIPSGAGNGNLIMSTPGAAFVSGIAPTVFDLAGYSQTVNGLAHDPAVTGTDLALLVITNSSGSATLTVGDNNTGGSYAGSIGGSLSLVKIGTGTETLSGTSTYTGNTVISNGTLAVNGSLATGSAVTVGMAGTLAGTGTMGGSVTLNGTIIPGSAAAIGTLTVSGTVGMEAGGTTYLKLNKTNAPATNDLLSAGTILYGGALVVTNLGPALAAGDTFTLFRYSFNSGSFAVTNLPPLGPGLAWTNMLANGTISVVSAATVNPNPTNIMAAVAGNVLTLSWPADHTGWRLLAQTNAITAGLNAATNDWFTVSGSTATNSVQFTVDPTQGTVFYRLVYP